MQAIEPLSELRAPGKRQKRKGRMTNAVEVKINEKCLSLEF